MAHVQATAREIETQCRHERPAQMLLAPYRKRTGDGRTRGLLRDGAVDQRRQRGAEFLEHGIDVRSL